MYFVLNRLNLVKGFWVKPELRAVEWSFGLRVVEWSAARISLFGDQTFTPQPSWGFKLRAVEWSFGLD